MRTNPIVLAIALASAFSAAVADDWPAWRGPEQTGMSRERAVVTSWTLDGENQLWKVPVGGRSTPLIMNGRLFMIGPVGTGVGRQERVICLDIENGNTIWEHRFNVFHTDIVENRVGWTSPVGDPESGNIYAHGTGGELFCFDRDGNILWKRSLTEEFGRASGYGGRLHNPVIDENLVIMSFTNSGWGSTARPIYRYIAFDKNTGQAVYWAGPGGKIFDATCYSTPFFSVIEGQRMMVAGNGDGHIYGMDARSGKKLWSFKFSKRGINTSVTLDGKYVFACHSEENFGTTEMGRVVCIDGSGRGDITETGEVWRIDGIQDGYASPAVANGRIYLADNSANLYAINARNGEIYWKYKLGRVSKGSPVVTADGIIYIGVVNGTFHILKDAGDQCQSLSRIELPKVDGHLDEIFGSAAVADGRVYLTTRYNTYCLAVPGADVESLAAVPEPQESAERTPSFRIFPADLTLAPGESVNLKTFGADANGNGVTWTVGKGLNGTIASDGKFAADNAGAFSAGMVNAKYGERKASARVRIGPKPPFKEDFESMPIDSSPPGWIGVGKKSQIVEYVAPDGSKGSKVLKKLAIIPSVPFMRIRWYSGPPIAGGYTVQCDVLGGKKETKSKHIFRPDMGLINSRYRMELLSTTKKDALRIVSWSPVPRLQKDVPFDWDADVWYRMKFSVALEDGKGHLRGKVWPRGQDEPEDWTIELIDPFPNIEGSPGLYGFSPGTTSKSKGPEVFYDNYEVFPNE